MDWERRCAQNTQNQNYKELQCEVAAVALNPLRQELVEELGPIFNDWNLIEIATTRLKRRLQAEIDAEKDFLRWLRGDKDIPSHEDQFTELNKDFDQLKDIVKKLEDLEDCHSEICDRDKNILQELKITILSKNSLLADPEVEKCLIGELKESSIVPCRKSALFHSVFNFVNFRIDLKAKINKEQLTEEQFLRKGEDFYKLFNKYYPLATSDEFYAYVIPEIFKIAESNPEKWTSTVCNILDKKEFRDKALFAGEVALEAGLIIAPFFFPPLGILNVGRLGYLARYGLTAERISGAAVALPTAALLSHKDLKETEEKCVTKQELYRSSPSVERYHSYKDCLAKVSDQKVAMASNMVLAVTPIPFAAKAEQIISKGVQVIKSGTNDVLSVVKPNVDDAKPIAEKYYEYVAKTYGERLKLSPEEIEGFMDSSRKMGDRTTLFLKTKANPSTAPPEFKGGIGVVDTKDSTELLPLEKATGFKVPRTSGEKSVEIVRLVSTDETNPNLMKELVEEAISFIKKDSNVTKAYVYTSRSHERLYRRLGIPFRVINRPSKRDVIMEFDVD